MDASGRTDEMIWCDSGRVAGREAREERESEKKHTDQSQSLLGTSSPAVVSSSSETRWRFVRVSAATTTARDPVSDRISGENQDGSIPSRRRRGM